jgi:hypothetical protein
MIFHGTSSQNLRLDYNTLWKPDKVPSVLAGRAVDVKIVVNSFITAPWTSAPRCKKLKFLCFRSGKKSRLHPRIRAKQK